MREAFISKRFNSSSRIIIKQAETIIEDHVRQGFRLTLRQLYYQFVARGYTGGENSQKLYKRIGSVINDARLAGQIDWFAIEDRTRNVRQVNMWDQPNQVLEASAAQYKENPWDTQDFAPEVWIEKDALIGVVEPVCRRWRVPYFACRGYTSQSEQYRAGKRFEDSREDGRTPVVFHLGDHDPSGVDMTRDNRDRLTMFAREGVRVVRLALNMDQIEQYNPPPNPAKETDSRAGSYIEQFGESSWELDALEPKLIDSLIDTAIAELVDQDAWDAVMSSEEESRNLLQKLSRNWNAVEDFAREQLL